MDHNDEVIGARIVKLTRSARLVNESALLGSGPPIRNGGARLDRGTVSYNDTQLERRIGLRMYCYHPLALTSCTT